MIMIFAFSSMLIDHIGRVFFPDNLIFAIIGRLSFPFFAWSIAKGFTLTSNYKKYLLRLLVFALVSQVPYSLLFKNGLLNIGFTLMAGLIAIIVYSSASSRPIKWAGIILLLIISQLANFDYGAYGVLTIFAFYLFRDNDYVIIIQGILTIAYILMFRVEPIQLFAVLSPILIMFLSVKDFKINRILKYSFYPAHLTLILLLTYIIPCSINF